jgi:hypothetical protein
MPLLDYIITMITTNRELMKEKEFDKYCGACFVAPLQIVAVEFSHRKGVAA